MGRRDDAYDNAVAESFFATCLSSSASVRARPYDNAVAESFFATLETELLDRTSFTTRNQARSAVFD